MLEKVAAALCHQHVYERIFHIIYGNLSVNHSTGSMIEVINMHKKDALNADHLL